jgi:nucleoside phosphorylase
MPTKLSHGDYTVAIISALWFETAACRGMLEETHTRLRAQPGDHNAYTLGKIEGHNVVLACLPGTSGNTAASKTSTNLMRTFPGIKTLLLVGIGGGVAGSTEAAILKRDLRLGDIVVAMPTNKLSHGLVEYDLGRETEDGFERKGFLTPPPELLRSTALHMRSDNGLQSQIAEHIKSMKDPEDEFQRPATDTDTLFIERISGDGNTNTSEPLARPPRKNTNPKVHYGLIATGDTVVKSTESQKKFVNRLAQEGDVLCFEMEAAGVATSHPCFVIRGICDYADSHKNKDWQYYAAAAAAAYAKELLLNLDVEDVQEMTVAPNAAGSEDRGNGLGRGYGTTTMSVGQGAIINGGTATFRDMTFNN